MKITKNLTEGNPYRNMLAFALPCLLASLLQQTYTTVDAIIAGKCINEFALGAIQSTGSFSSTLFSLFNGFALGFGIYISHLFGKKDFITLKRDAVHMIAVFSGTAVLVGGLLVLLRNPILNFLQIDPILRENAEIYFCIYSAGSLFTLLNPLLASTLRALGISNISLYTTLVASVINLGGNLFTVVVLDWGVAGLALSTVLSKAGITAIQAIALRIAYREMKTPPMNYRFSFSGVKHSFRYTFPAAVQQMAFHWVGFVIGPIINSLGAMAATGHSVASQMFTICNMALAAAAISFSTYTAQCAGEGRFGKIRKGVKVGFLLSLCLQLPMLLSLWIFASPLSTIFFPKGYEGESFLIAVRYVRVFLPFMLLFLVSHMFHSYLRSLGCIGTVFWLSVIASLTRLIFTLILAPIWELDGVYIAQILSWAIDAIVSFVIYFFTCRTEGHLRKKLHKVLE